MKSFFVYVLEFLLILEKYNISLLNVQKVRNLRAGHFESYSSFKYCALISVYRVVGSSDRVIDCNILILFRPSTTGTIPLATQIFCTATKWCASPQIINRNMQNFLLFHLFVF